MRDPRAQAEGSGLGPQAGAEGQGLGLLPSWP